MFYGNDYSYDFSVKYSSTFPYIRCN